jgi:hypothetical protein
MFKYLCVVYDRASGKELVDFNIEANNEYYARHKAANMFKELEPDANYDWYVDSLLMEDGL